MNVISIGHWELYIENEISHFDNEVFLINGNRPG